MAEDADLASGFVDQGRGNANGGRFASAVRPQQGKEITLRDFQVDVVQSGNAIFIGFTQLLDGECGNHDIGLEALQR